MPKPGLLHLKQQQHVFKLAAKSTREVTIKVWDEFHWINVTKSWKREDR